MSKKKPYKHHKRGAGQFVQLHHWFLDCPAWHSLKPGPRQLYIELKRRWNGRNNGRIRLSHREAAAALGVNRNTVGGYFDALVERGFIRMTHAPYLGPSGIGLASEWALEEEATEDGRRATKSFMRWEPKQNPRLKTGHTRPKIPDGRTADPPYAPFTVLKTGT